MEKNKYRRHMAHGRRFDMEISITSVTVSHKSRLEKISRAFEGLVGAYDYT